MNASAVVSNSQPLGCQPCTLVPTSLHPVEVGETLLLGQLCATFSLSKADVSVCSPLVPIVSLSRYIFLSSPDPCFSLLCFSLPISLTFYPSIPNHHFQTTLQLALCK